MASIKTRLNSGPRKVPEAKRVRVPVPENIDRLNSFIGWEMQLFFKAEPPQTKYAKHLFSITEALRENRPGHWRFISKSNIKMNYKELIKECGLGPHWLPDSVLSKVSRFLRNNNLPAVRNYLNYSPAYSGTTQLRTI